MINSLKKYLLKKIYLGQYRNGHFYSPVPDIDEIKKDEEQIFKNTPDIDGVDLNFNAQKKLLSDIQSFYEKIDLKTKPTPDRKYYSDNGFFNATDGFFLSAMMIKNKPKRIVEIGSGFSSALMMDINDLYFENEIELTFIEPNPERLYGLIDRNDFRCRIIEDFVQQADRGIFNLLEANDILFVDSSHIAKIGSDLNYILFNILPCLKPGVIIHFHDILYPFEYPKKWVYEGIYWNEAYFLKAFLMYNNSFEITLFVSYLYQYYNDWLKGNMPKCVGEGGSLWIMKK